MKLESKYSKLLSYIEKGRGSVQSVLENALVKIGFKKGYCRAYRRCNSYYSQLVNLMKSKIKAAGFLISIIAIIILTAGAVFLVSPALLYVVGIQYKSIKMLIVFVVVVLAATSAFQFLMEGIYLVAIKNKIVRINEDNLGFLIFNIISTFVIVLYIDFLMESIEISMFSAAIYSVLYCLAIKILDILADSLDDEDTDIQGE